MLQWTGCGLFLAMQICGRAEPRRKSLFTAKLSTPWRGPPSPTAWW